MEQVESINSCADSERLSNIVLPLDIDYLDSKILRLQSEIDSDRAVNIGIRSFFGVGLIICIAGYAKLIYIPEFLNIIFTVFSAFCFFMSFTKAKQKRLSNEIDLLEKKKLMIVNKPEKDNRQNQYFDSLVGINIKNLEEYYELVKSSNKKSFYTSLAMSMVGIILLVGGLIIGYFINELQNASYVATAAGILIELITALLFYLYNKTVIQLKEYHDSLLDVQNILLSFKLIDDIKDEKNRFDLMKQMMEIFTHRRIK